MKVCCDTRQLCQERDFPTQGPAGVPSRAGVRPACVQARQSPYSKRGISTDGVLSGLAQAAPMSLVVLQEICLGSRSPVLNLGYETAICPVCGQVLRVGYGLLLPEHKPAEQPVST